MYGNSSGFFYVMNLYNMVHGTFTRIVHTASARIRIKTMKETELTLTRLINAPRIAVWNAWTNPKLLAQWWGPQKFTNPVCDIDVRPGGSIHIDMRSPDGTVYPMSGKYLEATKPVRLMFICSALDKNKKPLFHVINTITFSKKIGKTKLVMRASVSDIKPEAKQYIAGQETGWLQSFDRLENFLLEELNHMPAEQNLVSRWQSSQRYLHSVLRIIASFMFILAGTSKLFAFPSGIPPNGGTVQLFSQLGIGAVLETFGGTLLLLGLFTQPVAFILAGEMAVAYFQFHFPGNFWPTLNGGVPAVLYCFIWLFFSAAGAGPWSLDAQRKK
jgi:putative oxidoreductase